ncbi:gamma-glutamylcyclotransferase [Halalkalicoccus sp. NIPERK01]|uniref:gamma-glutamylcyclotransferase family protein n=1 Tax=Halalkalicoccus sp. NIPERK01 TaxID=3053469 RepID=UPI00256F4090|nr:gamma-glutamylcyclotransferase family protein [Halalkalicoccus sp. NIPERK01]MDL5362742.1 gamma-glutamylcyclotransferase family protein [Halalkalicoccus sp. NIPERK01]
MTRVFVYGTLTDPERADALLDRYRIGPDAVLRGLHRVEGRYPTLAPGSEVRGRLLETPELDRLDAYEGVESGLYARVTLPVSDGVNAECYVGDPGPLGADAEWPGTGPFDARVRSYLEDHAVEIGRNE